MQIQLSRTHAVLRRGRRGNHVKENAVNPVSAGGEDAQLASFLATIHKEFARVLKVVAVDDSAQDSSLRNRSAVGADDQGNLALGHNCDGRFDNPVLPAEKTEVQSRL